MVNVLVVSDIRIYRDGLREVLVRSGKVCVPQVTAGSNDTLHALTRSDVDVVLLDCGVPDALRLARTIHRNFSRIKVLAFGLSECKDEIVRYAEAGISGYVSKDGSVDEMIGAILRAFEGDLECSAKVAAVLLERLTELAGEKRNHARRDVLTPREVQVAQLVGEGLTNGEIASLLEVRIATAKTHVHHVMEKLGVRRRGQVIRYLYDRRATNEARF